jgi:D-sedoheptulose 7-phosphate isomerase
MSSQFLNNIKEHQTVIATLATLAPQVESAIALLQQTIAQGGKIMLCGNGGSAADSQHIAAEFVGRFIQERKPLAAMALSTDTSALTCIGNDYSFADIFSRQVMALGRTGDCLIGISTSGNSQNVIEAVKAAHSLGIATIGLLGRDGGKLASLCQCNITVPSQSTARIQEAHILIGHTLCGEVEHRLGLTTPAVSP